MPLYKPSELTEFLRSIGASPRKSLSQNFLIDGNIIRHILAAGNIHSGDQIVEIGPGPGCLTEALLEAGSRVVAVEADGALAIALKRLETTENFLKIIQGDALKEPLEKIFNAFPSPSQKIKLFSNLPYHITTPLLTRFVERFDHISTIIVMVQDEVAKRMIAKPKTKDYGSLSLFLQFYADIDYVFKVSRRCFYPVPRVDSAVVRLNLKQPPDVDPSLFFQMTRKSFGQRRKVLKNSLKTLYNPEDIERALHTLKMNPLTRAEELSLSQFIDLFHVLHLLK